MNSAPFRKAVIAGLLALVALAVAGPVLVTGSWYASEAGIRYPYLLHHFTDALAHGVLYPRWLPDLMGGYGYPLFVFEAPGWFYFTAPFTLVSGEAAAARWSLWAALSLGAWGAYLLSRRWNGRRVSLALALLFLLTPVQAFTLYEYGDLGAVFALLSAPWCAVFAHRLRGRAGGASAWRRVAAFALSLAAAAYFHLWMAALIGAVSAASAAFPLPPEARERRGLSLALAGGGAMAAAAASPYWLPALLLPGMGAVSVRLIALAALSFGGFLVAARLLFPALSRRARDAWIAPAVAALVLLVALRPFHLLSPLVRAGVEVSPTLQNRALTWLADPLTPVDFPREVRKTERREFVTMSAGDAFPAHNAAANGLPNRLTAAVPVAQFSSAGAGARGAIGFDGGITRHHLLFTATVQGAARIALNQLYFPGWRVRVNGETLRMDAGAAAGAPALSRDAGGRMELAFPAAGQYRVEAYYEGSPGWLASGGLLVLSVAGAAALAWRGRHKSGGEAVGEAAWRA